MHETTGGAVMAAVLAALADEVRSIALPSPHLPGWESLVASEFAAADATLRQRVHHLEGLLLEAVALLGA